jgi:hypothetical protein
MKMEQAECSKTSFQFRHQGITQKKAYNIQNTVKVWKQECASYLEAVVQYTLLLTHCARFGSSKLDILPEMSTV